MNPQSILNRRYDVIVVGARPAGAGSAILLAAAMMEEVRALGALNRETVAT